MKNPRKTKKTFVITYIFCENPEKLLEFLKNAFYAIEARTTSLSEDGKIQNALLQIGESFFEISHAREPFLQVPYSFHLYTSFPVVLKSYDFF